MVFYADRGPGTGTTSYLKAASTFQIGVTTLSESADFSSKAADFAQIIVPKWVHTKGTVLGTLIDHYANRLRSDLAIEYFVLRRASGFSTMIRNMRSRDAERRAFLRSLKPRLIEIQSAVAAGAGRTVTQAALDADIEAAKVEYRAQKPPRKRPHIAIEL
jgi:hypothetical protein